jgi:hypothetical protein
LAQPPFILAQDSKDFPPRLRLNGRIAKGRSPLNIARIQRALAMI